jgi:hypothetical protein
MPRVYKPKIKDLPDKFTRGILAKLDRRTEVAQRLSITYNRIIEDCGGVENLPHVKLCLVERFAWLEECLRQMELKLAEGAVANQTLLGRWTQGVNAMTGLAKLLGLTDPTPRDTIGAVLYGPEQSPVKTSGRGFAGEPGDGEGKTTKPATGPANGRINDEGGAEDE